MNAGYQDAIAKADKFFDEKNYIEAQIAYEKATALKPEEKYPWGRLDELKVILSELAATEQAYQEIISEADVMLLKRLVKSRDERIDSETKTEPGR